MRFGMPARNLILTRKTKDLRYDSRYFHDFIRTVKKLPEDAAQGMTGAVEGFDREKAEEVLTGAGLYGPEEFGVACMAAFGYRAAQPAFPQTRQSPAQVEQWV